MTVGILILRAKCTIPICILHSDICMFSAKLTKSRHIFLKNGSKAPAKNASPVTTGSLDMIYHKKLRTDGGNLDFESETYGPHL